MNKTETIVVKLGGSLLDSLPDTFFQECVTLSERGVRLVVVHGGGPKISQYSKKLALKSQFVNGLRVTDAAMLELAEMVLGGAVNKQLVSRLEQSGGSAVGISGVDRGLLRVVPEDPSLGYVGRVVHVNAAVVDQLFSLGWIPVIASIGVDKNGQHYNINADTAAGAVACALEADVLAAVTDVPGVLDANGERLPIVTAQQVEELIACGVISGGMIPKVRAACASVLAGVRRVAIADGRTRGVLTGLVGEGREAFPGTQIVAEGSEIDGANANLYALAGRPV